MLHRSAATPCVILVPRWGGRDGYPLQQKVTTVLQALALAGGVTDRGATGRIQIVRIVDGERQDLDAELTDDVRPLDTIVVPERYF